MSEAICNYNGGTCTVVGGGGGGGGGALDRVGNIQLNMEEKIHYTQVKV